MLAADVRVIHPEDSARVNIPAGFPHALPLRVRHVRREPMIAHLLIEHRPNSNTFLFFLQRSEGQVGDESPVDGQV